jgi:hypothetical protein
VALFQFEVPRMNKETATAIMLSCTLLISMIGITFNSVKADSNDPIVFSGGVTLYSPVNTTYHINSLTLNLTCGCGAGLHLFLNYDIDGKYQGPITLTFNLTPGFHIIGLGSGLVQLPELPAGSHCLTIYEEAYLYDYYGASPPGPPFKQTAPGSADFVASWVDKVYFTIDSDRNTSESTPSDNSIPSNSSATPSASPEPTPTPYEEPQLGELEVISGVTITVAMLGAGLGLLLSLIKRK